MMNLDAQKIFIPEPMRFRFSVDEYYKMIELGLIKDYEKAEIIDGEMVKKMSIGDRHAWVMNMLLRLLIRALGDEILVRSQNPLRLGDFDEPEPDIVLADLTKYDGKRHPRPAETLIVMEVSDTSLRYDRDKKLPLYAQAEIPEVWIINLANNLIEVHQKPAVGIYQTVKIYRPGEIVESSVLPDLRPEVDAILSK